MAKYAAHHPKLPDKPGENWVSRAGGLPGPIDAVARALRAKGMPTSRAIATAVNHVKGVCATGRAFGGKTTVSPEARAKACGAVAAWEALKAKARADMSIPADQRRAISVALARVERQVVELSRPTAVVRAKTDGENMETWAERDLRTAVELAEARGYSVDLARIELAGSRSGLIPVKVKVRNRKGTTFERTMWVRPNQAKSMRAGKGPAKASVQGRDVGRAERTVLEQIAAIPKDQRPAGWDRFVRAVATGPTHGGRLGGEKRRLLRDLQANAPEGSPLKAAVTAALKADAKAPAKPKAKPKHKTTQGRAKRAAGKVIAGGR